MSTRFSSNKDVIDMITDSQSKMKTVSHLKELLCSWNKQNFYKKTDTVLLYKGTLALYFDFYEGSYISFTKT